MTRALVDTHAFIWWLLDDDRLSEPARETLGAMDTPMLSAGTLVEIAIKRSIGKLGFHRDWTERGRSEGFEPLAVTWEHAVALERLPFITASGREHRDPFDRLLVAQAQVERLPVVTRDPAIAAYGVPVIW
ncbi:MAG: type II toxin-antitoxin system VapC family toxin [Solirubrobacteraceae bacterium MAG38_C4-C5]|nr:type II toxin-antitoxin system VapC family toxin [Candidatus Siliceabacter maunaloa]